MTLPRESDVSRLKNEVSRALYNIMYNTTDPYGDMEDVRNDVMEILERARSDGAEFGDFEVSAKLVGWKDIYPKWGSRVLARVADWLCKKGVFERECVFEKESSVVKWYHVVFPYVFIKRMAWNHGFVEKLLIEMQSPDFDIEDDIGWFLKKYVAIAGEFILKVPDPYMVSCEVRLKPVKPVELIEFTVSTNGRFFGDSV